MRTLGWAVAEAIRKHLPDPGDSRAVGVDEVASMPRGPRERRRRRP